ncbi:MAG: Dyp-type peroxidase [Gammaproteobacteria bacterium]|nr:Dyp-type peroxidase [Gammaproteobacteria bacterium]
MSNYQTGILADVPIHSRYMFFSLHDSANVQAALGNLLTIVDGHDTVLGIGESALRALNSNLPGMKSFPVVTGPGIDIPSTPYALMLWLRGDDRGELLHRSRQLSAAIEDTFTLDDIIEGFRYRNGDDLTGYEDGTENPEGDDAITAAIASGLGNGLDGSSFIAIQQWVHDLTRFQSHSTESQDNMIGRRISDNEEIEDAPESAHVKRAAQEDFDPEAFVVRRSMPWSAADGEGLVFVAFGKNFNAFEALLNRMTGNEDGIVDALFDFTHPITGSYFWCPPAHKKRIDLSTLGIR